MRTITKCSATIAFLAFAALVLGTPACGGSACASQCERGKECGGAQGIDCDKFCSEVESTVANAECSSQFDDTLQCEEGLTDLCSDIATECRAEAQSLAVCLVKYCVDHQAEAGCQDILGGG